MQQTNKYKLNKPGVDDPIAIAPLNENMDKVEAALLTKAASAEAAALSQRVTVLEAGQLRIAVGTYTGDGSASKTISLGFTPKAVFVRCRYASITFDVMAVTGGPVENTSTNILQIVDGGFLLSKPSEEYWWPMRRDVPYMFMAIG